eukprot:11930576-Alexandrium_andersonii.AAC.1
MTATELRLARANRWVQCLDCGEGCRFRHRVAWLAEECPARRASAGSDPRSETAPARPSSSA